MKQVVIKFDTKGKCPYWERITGECSLDDGPVHCGKFDYDPPSSFCPCPSEAPAGLTGLLQKENVLQILQIRIKEIEHDLSHMDNPNDWDRDLNRGKLKEIQEMYRRVSVGEFDKKPQDIAYEPLTQRDELWCMAMCSAGYAPAQIKRVRDQVKEFQKYKDIMIDSTK